jgi:hypothetical protein
MFIAKIRPGKLSGISVSRAILVTGILLLGIFFSLFPAALSAQDTPRVIPLWANGAPGYENRRN